MEVTTKCNTDVAVLIIVMMVVVDAVVYIESVMIIIINDLMASWTMGYRSLLVATVMDHTLVVILSIVVALLNVVVAVAVADAVAVVGLNYHRFHRHRV